MEIQAAGLALGSSDQTAVLDLIEPCQRLDCVSPIPDTLLLTSVTLLHLLLQPALEELAFQNVGCSINACTSLAELVQNAQELRCLRLYNNMSDDAGAAAIAKVGPAVMVLGLGCKLQQCESKPVDAQCIHPVGLSRGGISLARAELS